MLAPDRADTNGVVRRHLDVRKISFAPMDEAVALTGTQYGSITPIGLPDDWPVLVDEGGGRRGWWSPRARSSSVAASGAAS